MRLAGIEWDRGNWPKCGSHGVPRQEIEEVVADADFRYFPDLKHSRDEKRWIGIGVGPRSGRWTLVIFTMRGSFAKRVVRPLSARYMHAKEVNRYVRDNEK